MIFTDISIQICENRRKFAADFSGGIMMHKFILSLLLIIINSLNNHSNATLQAAQDSQPQPNISYWQTVPANGEAPAFRYHLDGRGSLLHVEFQLPPGLDPNRWGIHVWVADPEVVNARVTAIRDLLKRQKHIQFLLKDKEHQDEMCQEDLRKVLSGFNTQLKLFRNYDPFHQILLRLPGGVSSKASMRMEILKAGLKPGDFSVEFDLDRHLDLSRNPVLSRLSTAFIIESLSAIRPGPLSNPVIVALPGGLRFTVTNDTMEDAAMLGTEQILLRPSSGAYRLWRYSVTGGVGCYGVEGLLTGPAFWINTDSVEIPTDRFDILGRLFKTEPREGIQLRFFQRTLAVQRHDKKELIKLELSSNGENSFELLDLQKVSDKYVLLMLITGYSRPYGGSSNCGAGMESNLVWILLDQDLKTQKQNSVLIESCFESAQGPTEVDKTQGFWSWEVKNYQKDTKFNIQYNPQKPLDGLDVRSTLLK
jgi:hypothetical protein